MSHLIFPGLHNTNWAVVDLNALYAKEHPGLEISRCNDAEYCTAWVNGVAKSLGVDFTYGGYMEDRSALWAGHYHDPKKMRHLGMDYNVPAGTQVSCPLDATVIQVLRDNDHGGGWGGRVILRPHKAHLPFVVFAHLKHDSLPFEGDLLRCGEPLGIVANYPENGGWYPHLHVQCISQKLFREGLADLDGYGLNSEQDNEAYPNPEPFMWG